VPHDEFVHLLNSYLAIEGLLESRFLSEETRQKAYQALAELNRQLDEAFRRNGDENTQDRLEPATEPTGKAQEESG
jgi:hypothetical protein